MAPLLQVKDLHTRFKVRKGYVYAVNGVSFEIDRGEKLGIVGESGCGKSVTMLSCLKLLPPAAEIQSGSARFNGKDLLTLNDRQMKGIRGRCIGIIFQDPMTSLNPVLNVGLQVAESLMCHYHLSKFEAMGRSARLLEMVGIGDPKARLREYPHQLSGGMRQRVMIAMALACEPELIIADEPTTALDVTIQSQITELVKGLVERTRTAVIWITHDLSLVAGLADRVLVMYGGRVVEESPIDDLYENPCHPYTRGLLGALPSRHTDEQARLASIPGAPPDLRSLPSCCSFYPRCEHAFERCLSQMPILETAPAAAPGHKVACWMIAEGRTRP